MPVTRDEAMDNAARALNNITFRCGPPDVLAAQIVEVVEEARGAAGLPSLA